MNPGELNHRITIVEDANRGKNITNENGFPVEDWKIWRRPWSKKQGLYGRVFYAAAATQSETDVVYKIRYINGLRNDMRIIDIDGTYKIKAAVDKEGKRQFLWITASKVDAI